ncbi:MAG: MG2 domain-containing protein [Lentisphaeria bacterium]|nr:MG2 domain-containing protein [Lentisphaeria bacterium]
MNSRIVPRCAALVLLLGASLLSFSVSAAEDGVTEKRARAEKLQREGNHKEAYDIFRELALDKDAAQASDINQATACLNSLGRQDELDALWTAAADTHAGNWRLLRVLATRYYNGNHYGFMISGEFKRGNHRGGGRWADATERDRGRALQLLEQARGLALKDADAQGGEIGSFFVEYARIILGYRGYAEAWKLQFLTDFSELPDFTEGRGYYGGGGQGAPVKEDGTPVYYTMPKNFESAANDGERWRWLMMQAMEYAPSQKADILSQYAQFLHQQFGVQTLQGYPGLFRDRSAGDAVEKQDSIFSMHTLKESETIAKLATGVKRFELPDEFNYIRIYRDMVAMGEAAKGYNPWDTLAQIFSNRRQFPQAAECWRKAITAYGPGHNDYRRKQLDQIIGNWARFEPAKVTGKGVTPDVDMVFRNGDKITFEAQAIDVPKLLKDVKDYIKSKPKQLDWNKTNIHDIGRRIVWENEEKYVLDKVADWSMTVEPAPAHFDKRITVPVPVKTPGAYLVTATMKGGNTTRIIVWIADTAIVEKKLDGKNLYFVADAQTGKPVPKATLDFFGYKQDWRQKTIGRGSEPHVEISQFAEFTDDNGLVIPDTQDLTPRYNWLITATTADGRFAYLGFQGVWYGRNHDQEYNQRKTYVITDRPVYRPDQDVKFKIWVRHAQYDKEDVSQFAGGQFMVRVRTPQGEEVYAKTLKADEYGGFEDELRLGGEAALGVYWIQVDGHGGGSFRVEEYKKPEFEVTVEAPSEPVMLGETVTAKVMAKYYFGSPVSAGKVNVKVQRYSHSADWWPVAPWDWFYGPGYWWFAYDYTWYPGWSEWCMPAPRWWWWPRNHTPPELVVDMEAEISADGILEVPIDTSLAKELYGHTDHRYEITAEVTDKSRRTIVGSGKVLVARKPFSVYTWVDRGHYRRGDTVRASFNAQTLAGKPVKGQGRAVLYSLEYDQTGKPVETPAQTWKVDTDDEGRAELMFTASRPGQYRLSYTVTDSKGHTIEGGYIFVVAGEGFDGREFRFNQLELIPDKKDYAPGETVELRINTERAGGTVLLFVRPSNGVCLPPKVIHLAGKSAVETIQVSKKDMPNFFVEAVTISDGDVHNVIREIVVPPEKRVLNVDVLPSKKEYLPGEKATIQVKLTDFFGEPFVGSLAMSVYDKSVEYISGGGNVPEIRDFFWKWRRRHSPQIAHNLQRVFHQLLKKHEIGMAGIGAFGNVIQPEGALREESMVFGNAPQGGMRMMAKSAVMESAAPMTAMADSAVDMEGAGAAPAGNGGGEAPAAVTVRKEFADTAFWAGTLNTDAQGVAEVTFDMPENLTGWKVKTWGMGHGTKVGQGEAEVVTRKNVILRLQAPRFFVEKDEVVLSANIHNYLKEDVEATAILELAGSELLPMAGPVTIQSGKAVKHKILVDLLDQLSKLGVANVTVTAVEGDGVTLQVKKTIQIKAGEEQRVDWRVKVMKEGEAVVRMKALTRQESDAMEMAFPVFVHGMDKMVSFSGVIRPEGTECVFMLDVPEERRINDSRLVVNYSPTLAGAMVDALPYLVEYPYGCTEQTLNRFVPTVITRKILLDMGLDLKAIRDKQNNLNAQELGEAGDRAAQWKHWNRNPVFDQAEVQRMVKDGVKRLTSMQCSDGGWGWFSGYGEHSYPHTTAVVVHGLKTAQNNDVAIVPDTIQRGIAWLKNYQKDQLGYLENHDKQTKHGHWKRYADNLDALIYMVLTDNGAESAEMRQYLYRDRNQLSVYGKAVFGLGLVSAKDDEKLAMITRNIEQYLVMDDENQTAYLKLPNTHYWWYWYGGEMEAHAFYLKLLARTEPKSAKAAGLVKYLLNNRKHATYWESTRDTAYCIEALAEYMKASGEDKPDMTVEVYVDGRKMKDVTITPDNLFQFDARFILNGDTIESGKHEVKLVRKGTGPLYANAYLSYFTLEDFIEKAGLEVKVNREVYKLVQDKEATAQAAGSRGQGINQKILKYKRQALKSGDTLKSGDLVEIEMTIDSKNDYEYIVVEDMKAAGFEPVEIRSGYTGNDMGAYVEFRDERVAFFVRWLGRGKHSVSYRLRAEIPGKFSALPTKISAMYAPELRGNSDEIKLRIED